MAMISQLRLLGFWLLAASSVGCGGDEASDGGDGSSQGGSSGSTSGGGGSGGTGGSATGGSSGNGGSGAVAGGPMGDPGCGLEAAAFCDNFNEPSAVRGRAGDLDPSKWSAARNNPQLATANGVAIAAGPATLPICRPGLPEQVFPSDDTLNCNPNDSIDTNHLLVAVGSQNYGQNSYRIRQPFDFTDRTGKIVFDAQGYQISVLIGWISIEVTEDPTPIPSFAIGDPNQNNDEGGAVPRNAFEVQFENNCGGGSPPTFGLRMVDVLEGYRDTLYMPESAICLPAGEGKLNHFEISVSQSRIEVYASPASDDGVTFEPVQQLIAADVDLPFSRGYVHITTHNHASVKYSGPGTGFGAEEVVDAWISRWDNVGFDGPIIQNTREYEIPDSLVPGMNAWDLMGPVMSTAYTVADAASGPKDVFRFRDVDLSDVVSAKLAIAAWYLISDQPVDDYTLQYRLNGRAWHDRTLTPEEIALLGNGHAQGSLGQMLDVPLDELVDGENTLEFQTVDVPQNYPPAVWAIDLVLTTN